ncbi:deoxyribose-phosphate aldolase [Terribacillus saccharophilus]|uniref:deoxyribose-phosphate aldolase n=1 Tax=Terribacillus saccharophilus TaxID=361277 RepID=UPI002DC1114D|nr:deoxyribose-phosphate aldolase [Terribacillus saccharophilus]
MEKEKLIELIDYTLLAPVASKEVIKTFCLEAITYGFRTVFVNPWYVPYAYTILSPHGIKVGAPIGFSLGGATTRVKVEETKAAIEDGASEIDMLVNLGAVKSREFNAVYQDIDAVVRAAGGLTTKVILETSLLNQTEKREVTEIIMTAGAAFVKTATGFNGGGATVEDIELLSNISQGKIGVKAAGGIKTYEDAVKMIESGATRIGASGAVAIIQNRKSKADY